MMAKAGSSPVRRKYDGKKKEEPLGPAFTAASGNVIIQEFATYEDYLDSQITLTDMFYLEDLELARQLVELGYRSNAEVMTRVDFAGFKAAAEIARLQTITSCGRSGPVGKMSGISKSTEAMNMRPFMVPTQWNQRTPKKLFSAEKDLEGFPFLKALAEREQSMATSKLMLATIIFIRDVNPQGHEISGYIDYCDRLKTDDLEPIFDRKKRFLPTPHDLSYYNWDTKISFQNHSSNWQVIADNETGILFKNKKDRKILNADPALAPGDLSTRIVVKTHEYKHVVIFDHITRRQN